MRKLASTILLAVSLAAALPACRGEKLRQELDHYLSEARWVWGFHGTVLVAYDGRTILNKGYGIANREFGRLNTPETKFFIGSITKQFTAGAILLLQEQGKLSVTDPVAEHLPDYPRPAADKITIHHLLTHTSGIPNYTDMPEVLLRRTSRFSPGELLRSFQDRPLEFEPGSEFRYSNSGYIVLGAIIEAVSGQSYEAFLHHYFLGPLGMDNSGYARREMGVPERADGYTSDENLRVRDAVPIHYSLLHTAGALYSTTGDMLTWDRSLCSRQILSRESLRAMFTPYLDGYGYGWVIDSLYGRRHQFHGGFIDGFNTTVERWPDQKLLVVVFANDDNAPVKKIAHGLAAIVFGEPHDIPVDKVPLALSREQLSSYRTIFETGPNSYRYVILENDTLHTYLTGLPREHLLAESVDTFFFAADPTRLLSFRRDDTGRITAAVLTDENRSYLAPRVDPDKEIRLWQRQEVTVVDEAVLKRYVGRYRMEVIPGQERDDFDLTVMYRDGGLYVAGKNTGEILLLPRTETDFFHRNTDFELSFLIDSDGLVAGCLLRMAGAELTGWKVR